MTAAVTPSPFGEENAVRKWPRPGVCNASPFANRWHRVGLFELSCVINGGVPGNVCQEVCLHCGKRWSGRTFLLRDQPNRVTRSPRRP